MPDVRRNKTRNQNRKRALMLASSSQGRKSPDGNSDALMQAQQKCPKMLATKSCIVIKHIGSWN